MYYLLEKHTKNTCYERFTLKDDEILEIRADNLRRILNDQHDGKKQEMAATIKVSPSALNKYLNPKSDRPCVAAAARKIERQLDLTKEYLDKDHKGDLEVYYVQVDIDIRFSYEIIEFLQQETVVQECRLMIGEHDLMLKIAIENYRLLDIFLSKISRLPGFKNSVSYQSVNSMSWQREQTEDMDISERDEKLIFDNGVDAFRHKKAEHYFSLIKKLYGDELVVGKKDLVTLYNFEFIRGVKKTLLSTRYLGMKLAEQSKYEKEEKELIASGVFAQRIIVLKKDSHIKNFDTLQSENNRYLNIKCSVRYLFEDDWKPTIYSDIPEYFIVMDDIHVAVRNENKKRLLISKSKEKVAEYALSFQANWKVAQSFDDIQKLISDSS